jgi:hypothetical protein
VPIQEVSENAVFAPRFVPWRTKMFKNEQRGKLLQAFLLKNSWCGIFKRVVANDRVASQIYWAYSYQKIDTLAFYFYPMHYEWSSS